MWVKFRKASKRQAAKAAKAAGYAITSSGRDTDRRFVYYLAAASDNPNQETLATLMTQQGALDTSWAS